MLTNVPGALVNDTKKKLLNTFYTLQKLTTQLSI
jgi:hypothetical protein